MLLDLQLIRTSRKLPPVPVKQVDPFSVLAHVTRSQKLNLKPLYNEGRFTIYQFTDVSKLFEWVYEEIQAFPQLVAIQNGVLVEINKILP